jgi:hypothetical protein
MISIVTGTYLRSLGMPWAELLDGQACHSSEASDSYRPLSLLRRLRQVDVRAGALKETVRVRSPGASCPRDLRGVVRAGVDNRSSNARVETRNFRRPRTELLVA